MTAQVLVPWTPPRPRTAPRRRVELTPMQGNVLESLAEGKDTAGIGTDWGIGRDTVKSHVAAILRRTGARDRHQLLSLLLADALDIYVSDTPSGWL